MECPFRFLHTAFLSRPARHYPRFRIRRSSSERRGDFNPLTHALPSAHYGGSDFARSFIVGYGSSPSRHDPAARASRMGERSPGSRAKSFRTCQGLRPRRAVRALAMSRSKVLPSAYLTASAPGMSNFSRLNGWPVRFPTDASPQTPSLTPTHGPGPMRFATPSSCRTFTDYSLPVSRRTG